MSPQVNILCGSHMDGLCCKQESEKSRAIAGISSRMPAYSLINVFQTCDVQIYRQGPFPIIRVSKFAPPLNCNRISGTQHGIFEITRFIPAEQAPIAIIDNGLRSSGLTCSNDWYTAGQRLIYNQAECF